jgi:hypothetical protein
VTTLIYLLFAHALFDYPLQGDFLAKGKNASIPLPGVPWYQCLVAHVLLHAGAVLWITGTLPLAALEFVVHWATDYAKCAGWMGEGERAFNIDQAIHYATKVVIWLLWLHFYSDPYLNGTDIVGIG